MVLVSELFSSLQGEGQYIGQPALFVRLSGCTRRCAFCDSSYHTNGREIDYRQIIKEIIDSKKKSVVWTGGEPLLQFEEIKKIIKQLPNDIDHHLESNGDLFNNECLVYFDYCAISPKDEKTAKRVKEMVETCPAQTDIKVVTDLTLNKNLIKYATLLMPLSVDFGGKKDIKIQKDVWNYCATHNIAYTPRLHIIVFGKKKGI